jgi:DNA polymerase-2
MKGYILYATYDETPEKTLVQLFGRLETGKSFCSINTHTPYFFVEKESLSKIKQSLKVNYEETNFKTFEGKPVTKITHPLQSELTKVASFFHQKKMNTYEADIKPQQRFLMDLDIKGSITIHGESQIGERVDAIYLEPQIKPSDYTPELKVLSIDIESDKHSDKLFCIGLYTKNYKNVFIVSDKKVKNATSCKNDVRITFGVFLYLLSYNALHVDDKSYTYDLETLLQLG